MTKKMLALASLPLLILGCVTSVTNLTATAQPRNPNNLYLIEYQRDTTQQTVKPDSIKPYVVVGFDTYEMRPTLKTSNPSEALVPIPPDKDVTTDWLKVNYE